MKPIEICPRCGSLEWKAARTFGILPLGKACVKCDYEGTFLVVDPELADASSKELAQAYRRKRR